MKRRLKGMCVFVLVSLILLCFAGSANAALIDNGDGTITDDDIGIMWKQESEDTPKTWQEALLWVGQLNIMQFAGYSDWRLPSAIGFDTGLPDTLWLSVNNEWGHLYGFEWGDPASSAEIAPMIGYECPSHWYWTGTEVPNDNTQAYGFFVSYMGFWLNHEFPKSEKLCVTAVRGPGAHPPRACFNESANSTSVCKSIDFYPDCSNDPDGDIVLYEWDFDSDGTVDYATTTPETVSHSFDSAGIYTVTLTVTDDDGLTDTFWEMKIVWPSQPPIACFNESATMVKPDETIDFYPGCSYDPDGDIVLYEWDFDSDGTIDHTSTTPEPASHTYDERGTYTVTLKVTDNHGLNDTFTSTKQVDILVVLDGDEWNDWPYVGSIVVAYVILILLAAIVLQMRRRGPGKVGPE